MPYHHRAISTFDDNDLNEPLQSLILIQGLLAQSVEGDVAQKLLERLGESLSTMSIIIIRLSRNSEETLSRHEAATEHLAHLTLRQHQVMDMVLAGEPSKNIAADLGISQRTVENHRASIMKKTGSKSLPALARLAQVAA